MPDAFGRALSDFTFLSVAEEKLLQLVRKGVECRFGRGDRPEQRDDRRKIRATFIRFLALGGSPDVPVHEKGVQLRGAYIEGDLDLASCKGVLPISIRRSLICGRLLLRDAHTSTLDFDGSKICVIQKGAKGSQVLAVDAAHAKITGSVYFRQEWDEKLDGYERFEVDGEVRFVSAEISGRLQCEGGKFCNPDGWALFCSRAKIKGGVFLGQDTKRKNKKGHESKPFSALGAVRFRGVEIDGNLECENGRIDISQTQIDRKVPSLCFDGATIKGHVQLSGLQTNGKLDFLGANLGGEVTCSHGLFANPGDIALFFRNARVKGSVHLNDGFCAKGEVDLVGVDIGGRLLCENGRFLNSGGKRDRLSEELGDEGSRALYFSGAKIAGGVLLNNALMEGQVRFRNAVIGGDLECDGAKFKGDGARALYFDRATIAGNVHMHKLEARGQVRFASAKIGGDLRSGGAKFCCEGKEDRQKSLNPREREETNRALFFSRARVGGSVFFNGVAVEGELRLRSAKIGGNLEFAGARLRNLYGVALYLSNTTIAGNAYFNRLTDERYDARNKQFSAFGEVRLMDVQVQGNLDFGGAQLSASKSPYALRGTGAKIWRNVTLGRGFASKGAVSFEHAVIDGNVDCYGGVFEHSDTTIHHKVGAVPDTLSFRSAIIKNTLGFYGRTKDAAEEVMIKGVLDLRDANVATLVDSKRSWPAEGKLRLDGFVYGRLGDEAPLKAWERKQWLYLQPHEHLWANFKPQPFKQLVKVLKEEGHGEEAKEIAIREQALLTRHARLKRRWGPWLVRSLLLGGLIRYGYDPLRIFVLTLIVWAACAGVYREAQKEKLFAPTFVGNFMETYDCKAQNGRENKECDYRLEYKTFNPWIFSLDVILPVVNLRQEDTWFPKPSWLETPVDRVYLPLRPVIWFETLWGWLAAIMLTAYIGGVIKKE